MAIVDPAERTARGLAVQGEVTGRTPPEAISPLDMSWRDFVFAEVWTREGLDRRSRYLIAIAGAAMGECSPAIMDGYVEGALAGGHLSVAELREAALHLAVYRGWGRGDQVDKAVSRARQKLGLPEAVVAPIQPGPWDPAERHERGQQEFFNVMTFNGPQPDVPYHDAGILGFVFPEMWCRDGLDQRSRRWLTLVGVCDSGFEIPIQSHIHASMASGNCTESEVLEFVLQYAIHAGWPKASPLSYIIKAMARKVEAGLPWNG